MSALAGAAQAAVHHTLAVSIDPAAHRLQVTDRLQWEADSSAVEFRLHAGLKPRIVEADLTLERLPEVPREAAVPLEHYRVQLPAGTRTFTLQYGGEIYHPLSSLGAEAARSFDISPGIIADDGVFLARDSYWYPVTTDEPLRFELQVQLPEGWSSVSQGERLQHERVLHKQSQDTWRAATPQEDIYLIAAKFAEYRKDGAVQAMAFLRTPDPALAQKYLDATQTYIDMYQRLIGPYPYSKFALVENFWETGYGMPSFTLLGPKVIRLPFILTSSYPHEILHNWWGNGVYVDYASGNWAEGLTAYLADHLIKEQQGQGVEHRRAVLQKYADYVQEARDFPLTEFRARHSAATEAVGYGKTLMLFHMLRRVLGDQAFTARLQQFYREFQFKRAGFAEVERVFNKSTESSLDGFFSQWVERSGAPQLRIADSEVKQRNGSYTLRVVIEQTQAGEPYTLRVPVAIHLAGRDQAEQREIRLDQRRASFTWNMPARPWRLDVDPEFDVFRKLDRKEIPPALSQAFGAPQGLIVLPSAAAEALRTAYQAMAEAWRGRGVAVQWDKDIKSLPDDRAVWLFGWENRFRAQLESALQAYPVTFTVDGLRIDSETLSRNEQAAIVVARHPGNSDQALAWIASDNPKALRGLSTKLPHYGKYSYLAFTGDEPTNTVKGQWPVIDSPMTRLLAEDAASRTPAALTERKPLIEPTAVFSAERMLRDIRHLAAAELEGRGLGRRGLDDAADYIVQEFRDAGLKPLGEDYRQRWTADVPGLDKSIKLQNVLGVIPGMNPDWQEQSVVIAAHYDHLGRGWPDVHKGDEGKIHPGADDNASGVAVLLELARVLGRDWRPQRSVIFAAFTGEEAGRIGSRHYVEQNASYPARQAIGMLNLDTVGRMGDEPLLVLGGGSADEWVHIFRGVGFVTGISIKTVEAAAIASSDQQSFHDIGVPAVHLVTAPNSDYHRPSDTPDKIDEDGLVKVATATKEALDYLAGRPEALTSRLASADEDAPAAPAQGRKVTLGTVPDFAWSGEGVRITGVTPGSPAEQAGLREGDIISAIDDQPIADLRAYAARLRELAPGAIIHIDFLRGGQKQSVSAQLIAR